MLKSQSLITLGALLVGIAVVAIIISRCTGVAPSTITGAGAGPALPGFTGGAAVSVLSWRTGRTAASAAARLATFAAPGGLLARVSA